MFILSVRDKMNPCTHRWLEHNHVNFNINHVRLDKTGKTKTKSREQCAYTHTCTYIYIKNHLMFRLHELDITQKVKGLQAFKKKKKRCCSLNSENSSGWYREDALFSIDGCSLYMCLNVCIR